MRLFQDAAGTIPATLPGQPVGLVKRMAGTVDAVQPTALSRPTLARWPKGGRRNLLTYSEELVNAVWVKTDASYVGTKLTESASTTPHKIQQSAFGAAGVYTAFFDVEAAERTLCEVWIGNASPAIGAGARFNLITGEVVSSRGVTGSTVVSTNITDLGGGIFRCSVSVNYTTSAPQAFLFIIANGTPANTLTYAGDGVSGLHVYRAQLVPGLDATPYQRVTTKYDITEAGVPDVWHLSNDGGDSLPVTLPAGTYGRARVNAAGLVTVDTVVDPTNALVSNQQVDIILRQGAFTPEEEAKIRAYWARYAA